MDEDRRIPVIFGQQSGPHDTVLLEDRFTAPALASAPDCAHLFRFTVTQTGHLPGCLCCATRGPAAEALGRAFRARATGTAPFFSHLLVLASPAGQAAIRAALAQDAICSARFRLIGED